MTSCHIEICIVNKQLTFSKIAKSCHNFPKFTTSCHFFNKCKQTADFFQTKFGHGDMPKVTSGKVTPQEFWNKCINKTVIATATIVNKVFLATEEIVIYQRWGVHRYIDSDLIHF